MKSLLVFVAIFCCSYLQVSFCEDKDWKTKLEGEVKDLKALLQSLVAENSRLKETQLHDSLRLTKLELLGSDIDRSVLNGTIEERVTLLELQVGDLSGDLEAVDDEVTLLTSDQLIQDQRILELEIDADGFEESIESLIGTDISINLELESLAATDASFNSTLINHEGRIQQQEVSGAIAFQAEVGEYASIPESSVVIFNQEYLNLGGGFNIQTGEFTVPPGGAGLYYFHVSFLADVQELSVFQIRVNGAQVCRAWGNGDSSGGGDRGSPSCGAVVVLNEGDTVHVWHGNGSDDTPVYSSTSHDNNFTGIRIAPQ